MIAIPRSEVSVIGRWWWSVDRWVLSALVALLVAGALLVTTAGPPAAARSGLDSMYFVRHQFVYLPIAMAVLLTTSLLDPRSLRRLACIAFVVFGLLTVMTLIFGPETNGAQRWLRPFGISVQPSEFLKPAFAVVAAWMFSERRLDGAVPGYGIATGLTLLVIGILLLQPDFGNAVLIGAIWFVEVFLIGLPIVWIAALALLGAALVATAYLSFDHVAGRIDAFLNPETADNYQVNTALDAFMSGGLLGRGPGEGTVKASLPDAHSDFVFAVAGEELGVLACIIIVGLFAFVVLRGFSRLLEENNLFVLLSVSGLLTGFGVQALINMASTLHLVPTKGITLPFISYGGSSLLGLAFGMGMVLALTRRRLRPGGSL